MDKSKTIPVYSDVIIGADLTPQTDEITQREEAIEQPKEQWNEEEKRIAHEHPSVGAAVADQGNDQKHIDPIEDASQISPDVYNILQQIDSPLLPKLATNLIGFLGFSHSGHIEEGPIRAWRNVLEFLKTLAFGLRPIHEAGYVVVNLAPWAISAMDQPRLFDLTYFCKIGGKLPNAIQTGFTAPEVAMEPQEQEIAASTDIYSLGCLAYALLTGKRFDQFSPQLDDLPQEIRQVIEVCLQDSAKARYRKVDDFIAAIERIENEQRPVLSVEVVARSCIGTNPERLKNEDCIYRYEEHSVVDSGNSYAGVFAVVDGMGGEENGARASYAAVVSFAAECRGTGDKRLEPRKMLLTANQRVCELGGGGAAATIVVIEDASLCFGHLGDTRLYLFRDGGYRQLTKDHSHPALMFAHGNISEDELRGHMERNQLVLHLGKPKLNKGSLEGGLIQTEIADELSQEFEVKDGRLELKNGDIFLLCSDGLWDWWEDEMTVRQERDYLNGIFAENPDDLSAVARTLVGDALENDGGDNISLILIKIRFHDMCDRPEKTSEIGVVAEAEGDEK